MNNSDKASYQSGGVGAGSGVGKGSEISGEISPCEAATPQLSVQAGSTGKASQARGEVGVARSSVEPQPREHCGEQRGGARTHATLSSEGQGDGRAEGEYLFERIGTPVKVRKLQQAFYRKAKADPKYRFYSLYGDLCRADVLETAMQAVAANGGGAGVDRQLTTVYLRSDEAWAQWRESLQEELETKRYKPAPVRRVYIPKGDGKLRPLGIPTVKDRVVQAALVLLLMPIFEADFHEHSYAYRPKRSAHEAIAAIQDALRTGRQEVIDADLSGYFDSIPHDKLMELVARRVSDGSVLALISAWLQAPVVEEDKDGTKRTLPSRQGTPQGGVISPLLANLYLDELDKAVNDKCGPKAVMVRYADDFVILCPRGCGSELLARLKRWLERRGLKLNQNKTRMLDAQREKFKFLGFAIGMAKSPKTKRWFAMVEPHPKSCLKLREKIRAELNHWTLHRSIEEVIVTVNRRVKGWANYFHYGNSAKKFQRMQRYINGKMRRWIWRKHACRHSQWEHYPDKALHEKYGVWKMPTWAKWMGSHAKG